MDETASRKLSYLYLIMTGMIIGIHSVSVASLGFTGALKNLNSYIRIFYDAATGTFFFFSAFLLFKKKHVYSQLLKKRMMTLFVPYMVFNIIAFFYKDVIRKFLILNAIPTYSLKELFTNIFLAGSNPPLWFMRVLIEFVVIYPILNWIVNKNEKIAWGGVCDCNRISHNIRCKCWI